MEDIIKWNKYALSPNNETSLPEALKRVRVYCQSFYIKVDTMLKCMCLLKDKLSDVFLNDDIRKLEFAKNINEIRSKYIIHINTHYQDFSPKFRVEMKTTSEHGPILCPNLNEGDLQLSDKGVFENCNSLCKHLSSEVSAANGWLDTNPDYDNHSRRDY